MLVQVVANRFAIAVVAAIGGFVIAEYPQVHAEFCTIEGAE